MEEKNPIQVSDRLFLVLETLAETGPVTLAALCQHLDLNKSTVHRLLCSLIYVGYVKQDPDSGKYSLSYKILALSSKALHHLDILETARPILKALAIETGETVHLVQLDGLEAVYIYKQEAYQNSIRMASKIGSRIPLYCSGVGKAMLADMRDEKVKEIWTRSKHHQLTPYTITRFDDLLEVIKKVRQNGYATDDEENEVGVRCIAASILDYNNKSQFAFSISAPTTRMTDERILQLSGIILETKKKLQAELHSFDSVETTT